MTKYFEFGIHQDKSFGLAKFRGMCGIELRLHHGIVQLEKTEIWQATSTSRFYCPTFAEFNTSVQLMVGSMKIITDQRAGGVFVLATSVMKPKRGTKHTRSFAGASIMEDGTKQEDVVEALFKWLKLIAEPESKSWLHKTWPLYESALAVPYVGQQAIESEI